MNPLPTLWHGICFIGGRLREPSTYIALGPAIAAASALPAPWSYLSVACGVMAAMVPNRGRDDRC